MVLAAGLTVWLPACSSAPQKREPAVVDLKAACMAGLDRRHVVYEPVQDWSDPNGCGIQGAILVKRDATEWSRATLMACGLETTLYDFEVAVLQPAAQRHFHHNVKRIVNLGVYNCRNERSERSDRLSQHALGKAIDISGFELDDGTVISVLKDWPGKTERSEFLHEAAKEACGMFSVVVTPNQNALHRDHLHLDIGPFKYCGA